MDMILKGGYLVYPENGNFKVCKKDVGIISGKIVENISENDNIKSIDCHDKVIMPGLVNAHHHIYSTLSKGIPCETPFNNFLGNLKQLWWRLDRSLSKEDMVLSTALTMEECLKQGVTTVFDHHISVPFIENSLSVMAETFGRYGIQGGLAFEVSDRNGKDVFERSLSENLRFAETNKNENVKGMLGMHASFTLSNESLRTIADRSGNLPIHIHIGEDVWDEEHCFQNYGTSVIERLEGYGLLRRNSLLVHCNNLKEEEFKVLQGKQLFVVQAVDSNMNNGLNAADFHQFWKKGLACVTGTDGMHSSILKSLKNSFLLMKFQNRNADIGFGEIESILRQMYKLKSGWGFDLGFKTGDAADLIVLDYEPATPLRDDTIMGHFIYGITEARVKHVVKGSKILLRDHKLTIEPFAELKKRSQEISEKLFKRFINNGEDKK